MVGIAAAFSWPHSLGPEVMSAALMIPAKAMLFGEYGVLYGGPALVATLAEPCFVFHMRLEAAVQRAVPREHFPTVTFESDMVFPAVAFDSHGHPWADVTGSGPVVFLSRVLASLTEQLGLLESAGLCVRMRVERAFSPDLGLGSSSAIVVGLVALVTQAVSVVKHHLGNGGDVSSPPPEGQGQAILGSLSSANWHSLLAALHAGQGRGSGYDVAVQFLAARWLGGASGSQLRGQDTPLVHDAPSGASARLSPRRRLWTFWPAAPGGQALPSSGSEGIAPLVRELPVPKVDEWTNHPFWNHAGWLLPSGQAAATGQILERQGSREPVFAREHAALALRALDRLQDPGDWMVEGRAHPFADLLDACLDLAEAQGIAGHLGAFSELAQLRNFMAYKTMGAGHGDSVWTLPRVLMAWGGQNPPPAIGGRPIIPLASKKDTLQ